MKNDNIHSFFSPFWLQILNLPASLQNKNTRVGPFPWKRSVQQNPDRERTNQSTGICLRLGLPYNKYSVFLILLQEIMNKIMSREDSVSSAVDVAREVHRRNLVTEETGKNIEKDTQSLEDRLERLINKAQEKKKR